MYQLSGRLLILRQVGSLEPVNILLRPRPHLAIEVVRPQFALPLPKDEDRVGDLHHILEVAEGRWKRADEYAISSENHGLIGLQNASTRS